MFGHARRSLLRLLCATAVALTPLVVVGTAQRAAGAPTLPAGFVLRDTATGQGAYNLTDFAYLPDGSMLTAGKDGRVTWLPAGGGAPRVIAELSTDTSGDLGLVGLAVAPDYEQTGHIYLIRSLPDVALTYPIRLSRFTVAGAASPTGLTNETVVLQVAATASAHGMTTVLAEPDGTLWVSIGDLQTFTTVVPAALEAMNPDLPAGKLLHVKADGTGVPSNPYYDPAHPSSWRSRLYASGFRSPFRMSLNPSTGTPVVGEVGWRTWEEVDLVAPGQDYKWPCWEGPALTPGYSGLSQCLNVVNTAPLWDYHHGTGSNQGNSVTGGIVYTGTSYPQQYRGAYFFGDYAGQKLWTMRVDGTGQLVTPPQDPPFATDIGGPVKFAAAPNGDIVYADIVSGSLRRLSYSPGNTQPVAKAATTTDPATRIVTFDGSGSIDFDGDTLTYAWDFGDGTAGQGKTVSHAYTASGDTFNARLTVTDPLGASDTAGITVAPSNHSPALDVTAPGNVDFAVGDAVPLSATANDAEDGALPVSWTSAVVHCPEVSTCHLHPGTGASGPTWQSTFPDHPDAYVTITATVQDSAGVQVSKTYDALPRQHRLTLTSDTPAVLQMPAEGSGTTAMVTEGAQVDVVAANVAVDGVATFDRWADGPTQPARLVSVGSQDLTLTARYLTPIARRYRDEPALRALLGAPTAPEIGEGGVRFRDYQAGRLYWTRATGAHETHGGIFRKFLGRGGHAVLGVPLIDETTAADGVGRYSDFSSDRSIYWTATTDAHVIGGSLRQRWRSLGAGSGLLGYPVVDERRTSNNRGWYVRFSKREGAIYWSRTTGAREIYGPIRRRWSRLGSERSYLGFPTSGVRKVTAGLRSDFQHGYIRWYRSTGRTVDRRY